MTADMEALIKRRTAIKSALTRLSNYVNSLTDDINIDELQLRFKRNCDILERYDNLQTEIEVLDSTEKSYEQERKEFEDSYYATVSKIQKLLSDAPSIEPNNSASNSAESAGQSETKNIKLPQINLPHFHGDSQEWYNFEDTFTALVKDNAKMSEVEKFYYLQSCLKGKAEEVIKNLPASSNNFEVAWTLLKERFENKRVIIFSHIASIVDFPPIQKENAVSLRSLLDEYLKHTRALKLLEETVDSWGCLLIYVVVSKLDSNTRKHWETDINPALIPTLKNLEDFLKKRCQVLETMHKQQDPKPKLHKTAYSLHVSTETSCHNCTQDHWITKCEKFLALAPCARKDRAKELKLCFRCLGKHKFNLCKAKTCYKCRKPHHTLLHYDTPRTESGTTSKSATSNSETEITAHITTHTHVLLATAQVCVGNGRLKGRALLDSGSTANYITKDFAKRAGLATTKIGHVQLSGVNGTTTLVTECVTTCLRSANVSSFKSTLTFLILDKVTENLPRVNLELGTVDIPNHLTLADNCFNKSGSVDLLIGAQVFFDLLLPESMKIGGLAMRNSKLGWLIAGALDIQTPVLTHHCHTAVLEDQGQAILEKFWKLEEIPQTETLSAEELKCEEDFKMNTTRDDKGRFVVKYPEKENRIELGDSLHGAFRSFLNLEKRLNKTGLKQQYTAFMREFIALGHMEKIGIMKDNLAIEMREQANTECTYYIPHHCVQKHESSTTKLRVVFNASAPTSNGVSLNDVLLNGPIVQSGLFSILLRLRQHPIVLSADVKMMFRQVLISKDQHDLQRLLWRESENEPISVFRIKTVTYGIKPATYVTTRCLNELANNSKEQFPDASRVILEDMYVDDLTTGAGTVEEALRLKGEVEAILSSGGFELRKWRTNSKELLVNDMFKTSDDKHFFKGDIDTKTLGVIWDANEDLLKFCTELNWTTELLTKRSVLSKAGRIFDPLGLTSPVTVRAKLFFQNLWTEKLCWDERLTAELQQEWTIVQNQLQELNSLKITRLVCQRNCKDLQLHIFSDASLRAYGTAAYIRSTSTENNREAHLLCAKTRVAPLKRVTLPRLELLAACLSSDLLEVILSSLNLPFNKIYCWSDSKIVLSWIKKPPITWKQFVANRVAVVQQKTEKCELLYVPTKQNPADLLTRGVDVCHLTALWWSGPQWLCLEEEEWPSASNLGVDAVEVPEKRATVEIAWHATVDNHMFDKYSSFKKLLRITGWCLRFCNNAKGKKRHNFANLLSIQELDDALTCLIRVAQREAFKEELKVLKGGLTVSRRSSILSLDPFLDEIGLIRVGGRLRNSELNYSAKHPIVLPKCQMTNLLIRDTHLNNLHAGAQTLLAILRERYWIVAGLSTVKKILRKCIICFKYKPRNVNPKMGSLPPKRCVQPSRVFQFVTIDYAGPFNLKETKFRNKKFIKCYICIFVCCASKAVHMELATDLSLDNFVNCLKRFVARRGIPTEISSDNAKTFVGADRYLKEIYKHILSHETSEITINFLHESRIKWSFIPARAPHFGGLHESNVKSFKMLLYKAMHSINFHLELFLTTICEIESILNSRPLCPMSCDPNDLTALTPGHFIIGANLKCIPEVEAGKPTVKGPNEELRKRIKAFWKRWTSTYLNTLQQRSKWITDRALINIGSLVLLKEDNLPSHCWRMGRVEKLHPGRDNIVRVVTLRTTTGTTTRALGNLCPLPMEAELVENCVFKGEYVRNDSFYICDMRALMCKSARCA